MIDLISHALGASTSSGVDPWELAKALAVLLVVLSMGIAAIAGACAVIWRVIRGTVLDYLKRELISPVQETHKQVTVNGGLNNPPTIPDLLDKAATKEDLAALRSALNDHVLVSSGNRGDVHSQLERIEDRLNDGDNKFEQVEGSLATMAESFKTFADSQKDVWSAIEAVAKAKPPKEPHEPTELEDG